MDNRLGQDSGQQHDIAMVLDLKVKAEVLLGRKRLPLGELMTAEPGQILELEAQAQRPLQLLVNGALVAEGEIVILDDRYGLRLTHIVSPSERSCVPSYPSD